jgi:hypothetical protein
LPAEDLTFRAQKENEKRQTTKKKAKSVLIHPDRRTLNPRLKAFFHQFHPFLSDFTNKEENE